MEQKTVTLGADRLSDNGDGHATPDLRQLVTEDRQRRVKAVEAGIAELLEEHECALEAVMILSAAGNTPQLRIIPKQ